MIVKSDHISRQIALYSIYGYFLSTTFSHALAQNLLGLAIICSIVLFLVEKRSLKGFKYDFLKLSIFMFIYWSIVSALLGPTPLKSLFILKEEWLFLMIPVIGFIIRDKKELRTALIVFTISAVVVGLYAVWQHFGGVDLYRGTPLYPSQEFGYKVRGFFSHRLTFGNYFAAATLLFWGLAMTANNIKEKIFFYAAIIIGSVALFYTQSRGPILVLIIGTIISVTITFRKMSRGVLVVMAAVVIIIAISSPGILKRYSSTMEKELNGDYSGSRVAIFTTAFKIIRDNPLFGVGQGNFREHYVTYCDNASTRKYHHAHNDILNIAAYAGLPAALFFIGIWIGIFQKMVRLFRRLTDKEHKGILWGLLIASFGFFMTSFYEATFADEEVRMLLMAFWGLVIAMERINRYESKTTNDAEKA